MSVEVQARKTLSNFFEAWQAGHVKTMLEHCQLTWRATTKDAVSNLESLLHSVSITKFRILSTEKVSDFLIDCVVEVNDTKRASIRIVKELAHYKTRENIQWPISALRLCRSE